MIDDMGREAPTKETDPAEKRQLVDPLYNSMIEIGQYGGKAMKQVDDSLRSTGVDQ
jgi:hypothetical protein